MDLSPISYASAPSHPRGFSRAAWRAERRRKGLKFDPGWPDDRKAMHPGFWRPKCAPQCDAKAVGWCGEHIRMSNGQVRNPSHEYRRLSRADRRRGRKKFWGAKRSPSSSSPS